MITSSKGVDSSTKEEGAATDGKLAEASNSSTPWFRLKDPRIVRVSRALGGKDRHSKVCTIRGLRDRRVRLSVPTAIQLYDLQDRLGLNQPSKAIDWLLNAAKDEIDELPPLPIPPGNFSLNPRPLLSSSLGVNDISDSNKEGLKLSTNVDWHDPGALRQTHFWSSDAFLRGKSKEVARDSADEKHNWSTGRNEEGKEDSNGVHQLCCRKKKSSQPPCLTMSLVLPSHLNTANPSIPIHSSPSSAPPAQLPPSPAFVPPTSPSQPLPRSSPTPPAFDVNLVQPLKKPVHPPLNQIYPLPEKRWRPREIFAREKFISYFINYIPEDCSPQRLFEAISKSERVLDVVIPAKKTIRGTRFGFAKFIRSRDRDSENERLAVLNTIRIGHIKLSFNVAKYNAQNRKGSFGTQGAQLQLGGRQKGQKETDNPGLKVAAIGNRSSGFFEQNRSFASVLMENVGKCQAPENLIKVQADNLSHNLSWLCRSAVGTIVQDFQFLSSIPPEINVKLLGGDMVLLIFPTALAMHDTLSVRKEPWLNHFSDVHPWRSDDRAARRLCWVSLFNVPIQSWETENFRRIVKPFGRFLQTDSSTQSMERFDIAKVCIVTERADCIKEEVSFCLGGVNHRILVQEIPFWGLPYDSLSEGFKLSNMGADRFQSPLSSACIPRAQPNHKETGSVLGVGPVSRPTNEQSPLNRGVPSREANSLLQVPSIAGEPNLSDILVGPPIKAREFNDPNKEKSQDNQETAQTSYDQTVGTWLKKTKKKSNKDSSQMSKGKRLDIISCTRRISFEDPKEISGLARSTAVRLSKRLLERGIRRKRRFKGVSDEGSLRSPGNSNSGVIPQSIEGHEVSSLLFTEPFSRPQTELQASGSADTSRVSESLEIRRALQLINSMGLEVEKPISEFVSHLEKKIAAESHEMENAREA